MNSTVSSRARRSDGIQKHFFPAQNRDDTLKMWAPLDEVLRSIVYSSLVLYCIGKWEQLSNGSEF